MFFIHTLEGLYRDLSLEALIHKKELSGVNRNSRIRKLIREETGDSQYSPEKKTLTYAEKTYREAMKLKNQPGPIFHAYQIMSSPVKTIKPEMKITEAWNHLKRIGVRHTPVVSEEKKIEGIISDRDLLKRLLVGDDGTVEGSDQTVGDIMVHEVITASMVTDIRRIAMVMFKMHIGTMPVLDEDKNLAGIVTRSDILHALITYPPLKLWG